MSGVPAWITLAWRLPSGSSTPRVTTWRNLQRLGAARLTPGAAILPYREDLQEQLDWIAQEIENLGGDAWVLPVTGLSDREQEYRALENDARAFSERRSAHRLGPVDHAARLQVDKELLALQRRFRKVVARDYVGAPARAAAAEAIDRCLVFRQGISPKLTPVTDAGDSPDHELHHS
jgi:hypothetical protein